MGSTLSGSSPSLPSIPSSALVPTSVGFLVVTMQQHAAFSQQGACDPQTRPCVQKGQSQTRESWTSAQDAGWPLGDGLFLSQGWAKKFLGSSPPVGFLVPSRAFAMSLVGRVGSSHLALFY